MICTLAGIGATVVTRELLVAATLDRALPAPLVVYLAIAVAFSFGNLARMAELGTKRVAVGGFRRALGRLIAFAAFAAALILGLRALNRVDHHPRTQDALFFMPTAPDWRLMSAAESWRSMCVPINVLRKATSLSRSILSPSSCGCVRRARKSLPWKRRSL